MITFTTQLQVWAWERMVLICLSFSQTHDVITDVQWSIHIIFIGFFCILRPIESVSADNSLTFNESERPYKKYSKNGVKVVIDRSFQALRNQNTRLPLYCYVSAHVHTGSHYTNVLCRNVIPLLHIEVACYFRTSSRWILIDGYL